MNQQELRQKVDAMMEATPPSKAGAWATYAAIRQVIEDAGYSLHPDPLALYAFAEMGADIHRVNALFDCLHEAMYNPEFTRKANLRGRLAP